MKDELELHHNLICLPSGRRSGDVVAERHEVVLLFDASKANPNGDPDTGNMPRLQPDTLRGLVTDVCLKRKIRNFFSLYLPHAELRQEGKPSSGYEIFIRENAVLEKLMTSTDVERTARDIFEKELGQTPRAWDAKKRAKGEGKKKTKDAAKQASGGDVPLMATPDPEEEVSPADEFKKRAYRDSLCRTFFDLRAFGGVISTEGPLKGSFYGQVRGPIQFSFAESLDQVLQLDATITRCAVASEKEKKESEVDDGGSGHRTMGRKHVVDYGLYRSNIYFSPAFAAKTRFTYYDLDNFLFALMHMFRDDAAAGRAGLRVVGLVDFQHATALGNEHAHKLFDLVRVSRTPESRERQFPQSLLDYCGTAPDGNVREVQENGHARPLVVARKLVWDIAEAAANQRG